MAQIPAHPLLTAAAIAERAGVHPETVRRWVRDGRLKAVVLPSGRLRFRPEDVEAFLGSAA